MIFLSLFTSTLNCTEVPEDVRAMCRDEVTREELTAMAAKEPAGCRGLTYVPYLRGERTPNGNCSQSPK